MKATYNKVGKKKNNSVRN